MRLCPQLLLAPALAATLSLQAQTAQPALALWSTADPAAVAAAPAHITIRKGTEPANNSCYSLRSYRFKRDDHLGDAVLPAGYSTCLAASSVQKKSADVVVTSRPTR